MDASQQRELLLCALKHFDIEVLEANSQNVMLNRSYAISLANRHQYQILKAGRPGESFSDVVKLCTFIKLHLDLNEETGAENSGAGQ